MKTPMSEEEARLFKEVEYISPSSAYRRNLTPDTCRCRLGCASKEGLVKTHGVVTLVLPFPDEEVLLHGTEIDSRVLWHTLEDRAGNELTPRMLGISAWPFFDCGLGDELRSGKLRWVAGVGPVRADAPIFTAPHLADSRKAYGIPEPPAATNPQSI